MAMITLRDAMKSAKPGSAGVTNFGRRDDMETEGVTDSGDITMQKKRTKKFPMVEAEGDQGVDYPMGIVSGGIDPEWLKKI